MSLDHRKSLVMLGVAAALALAVGYWRTPMPRGLLPDMVGIALLTGASTCLARDPDAKWPRRVAWASCGALTFAAAASTFWMPPWIYLVALAFGASGVRRGPAPWREATRAFGLVVSGALVNVYLLGILSPRTPLSVEPAVYRTVDLRVHSFLDDVPLRDVWAIQLQGGGDGRSIRDLQDLPSDDAAGVPNPLAVALVGARLALGWVFDWDDEAAVDPRTSYVHRLTAADRERCLEQPGRDLGGSFGFRMLYSFPREVLYEVENRTVHAFVAQALVPASDGYRLFVGIYVKRTGWSTPCYMAFIDPFRRLILYPDMLQRLQGRWEARWGSVSPPAAAPSSGARSEVDP